MLEDRFTGSDVAVHTFGVGKSSGWRKFSFMSDATSGHPGITEVSSTPHATIDVRFESIARAAKDWPKRIDIAEINIEGGGYGLISALAEANNFHKSSTYSYNFMMSDKTQIRSWRRHETTLQRLILGSGAMRWCGSTGDCRSLVSGGPSEEIHPAPMVELPGTNPGSITSHLAVCRVARCKTYPSDAAAVPAQLVGETVHRYRARIRIGGR